MSQNWSPRQPGTSPAAVAGSASPLPPQGLLKPFGLLKQPKLEIPPVSQFEFHLPPFEPPQLEMLPQGLPAPAADLLRSPRDSARTSSTMRQGTPSRLRGSPAPPEAPAAPRGQLFAAVSLDPLGSRDLRLFPSGPSLLRSDSRGRLRASSASPAERFTSQGERRNSDPSIIYDARPPPAPTLMLPAASPSLLPAASPAGTPLPPGPPPLSLAFQRVPQLALPASALQLPGAYEGALPSSYLTPRGLPGAPQEAAVLAQAPSIGWKRFERGQLAPDLSAACSSETLPPAITDKAVQEQLKQLQERVKVSEAALAQTEQQNQLLTNMVKESNAAILKLGEEAESQAKQLRGQNSELYSELANQKAAAELQRIVGSIEALRAEPSHGGLNGLEHGAKALLPARIGAADPALSAQHSQLQKALLTTNSQEIQGPGPLASMHLQLANEVKALFEELAQLKRTEKRDFQARSEHYNSLKIQFSSLQTTFDVERQKWFTQVTTAQEECHQLRSYLHQAASSQTGVDVELLIRKQREVFQSELAAANAARAEAEHRERETEANCQARLAASRQQLQAAAADLQRTELRASEASKQLMSLVEQQDSSERGRQAVAVLESQLQQVMQAQAMGVQREQHLHMERAAMEHMVNEVRLQITEERVSAQWGRLCLILLREDEVRAQQVAWGTGKQKWRTRFLELSHKLRETEMYLGQFSAQMNASAMAQSELQMAQARLQQEEQRRKAAEEGWARTDAELLQLKANAVASTSRTGDSDLEAALHQMDEALNSEYAEVARLKQLLEKAESSSNQRGRTGLDRAPGAGSPSFRPAAVSFNVPSADGTLEQF